MSELHPTPEKRSSPTSRRRTQALAAVAFAAGFLMALPQTFWHHPPTNAVYSGLDRNLIYADPVGGASATGIIQISSDLVRMVAVPGSRPTVDLLSSDMDFKLSTDLEVIQDDSGGSPLTLMIWSPRENSVYSIEFGSAPLKQIHGRLLLGGVETENQILGTYQVGVRYHLEIALSRSSGTLSVVFKPDAAPAGNALVLIGGPSEPGYTEVDSDYLPVHAGHEYAYGGTVSLVQGSTFYKLALDWFDRNKKRIGSAGDWRPVNELAGWTKRTVVATAPPGAAYARMILGAGDGRTRIRVTNLFVRDSDFGAPNLLQNGDFALGTAGWTLVGGHSPQQSPQTETVTAPPLMAIVDQRAAPTLFYLLPVAVTLSSNSDSGLSVVTLANYRLTIPSQPGVINRTDGMLAFAASAFLMGGGALLFLGLLGPPARWRLARDSIKALPSRIVRTAAGLRAAPALLLLATAYLLLNALFFGLGAGTFDMAGQKIFAYVGAFYGPAELYFLPNTVTPAEVWGGVPFAGETFPYGPLMVWFFSGIGWIYRLFGVGPLGPDIHEFGMESLIKFTNVGFGLVDGLLIYLTLRESGARTRTGLLAAALFLLNPAVWFLMSVWGETQTITLSLLLLGIWAARRGLVTLAWVSIGAASLSRPQLIVPCFVLGILLLRWFPIGANAGAVARTIVLGGITMGPLFLALGPSLPATYLLNLVHSQSAADAHASQFNYISYDGYSIWPLVTGFVSDQVGKARIYYPESAQLFAGFTYKNVANVTFGLAFGLVVLVALLRGRRARLDGTFIPIVGSATMALLMFQTAVSAQHFVIGLALVIMSIDVIAARWYYPAVIALSITTFVSMYGSLGFALSYPGAAALAPALYGGANPLTRFFMNEFANDQFITIAIAANLTVLLVVASASVLGRRTINRTRVSSIRGNDQVGTNVTSILTREVTPHDA